MIVSVFSDVRDSRNNYRDQGIQDFRSVLGLYNEVLKGWLTKICKTPVLTILRNPGENLDFIPQVGIIATEAERKNRFLGLQIRVNTILTNLTNETTPKSFPAPLMTFMNSFMVDGGFVPYDFLSEFEQDTFEFDASDGLKNFGAKQKVLFIGTFIITQYLIDRILMMRPNNGFSADAEPTSQSNLVMLAALIHGIFSEVIYDMFKSEFV